MLPSTIIFPPADTSAPLLISPITTILPLLLIHWPPLMVLFINLVLPSYIPVKECISLHIFLLFVSSDDTEQKKKLKTNTLFTGIYEGRTKFIKRTIRGGQCINSKGNIVIIGDINSGAEVSAGGNIIVLGSIRGHVRGRCWRQ